MFDWQIALDEFFKDWHKVPEFDGALLTGSYATGTPSAQSDIDVMLVLSNQATYYQRGNCLRKSFMIEYIAQPKSEWRSSFAQDQKNRTKLSISMFATGIVIFDPKGVVHSLKNKAELMLKKTVAKITKEDIEIAKYHLYDGMSKLQNIQEKGFSFYAPQYYLQLSKIIGYYAHFQRIALPATSRWDRFLNDPQFRVRYQLQGFSDDYFVSLFNYALKRYPSIESIIRHTLYTLKKLGRFEINGWIIRKNLNQKNLTNNYITTS